MWEKWRRNEERGDVECPAAERVGAAQRGKSGVGAAVRLRLFGSFQEMSVPGNTRKSGNLVSVGQRPAPVLNFRQG